MFKKLSNEDRSSTGNKSGSAYASMLKPEITIPFFKARDGENQVRLLPIIEEEKHMKFGGLEVWTYYTGSGLVVSPSTFGQARDPLMAKYKKYKMTDPKGKAQIFKPSKHILNYILNYNPDEDRSVVHIWRTSEKFRDNIFGRAKDRETKKMIPIEDPEEGRILFFEKQGQGRDTQYSQEEVGSKPDVLIDVDAIAAQMRPFEDILFVPSYDELENLAADMECIPVQDDREDDWGTRSQSGASDDKVDIEKQDRDSDEIAARIRAKMAGKENQS